ncbi:MAG: M23 family metallopeptidase, partial [Rhodospirillales bacterium]|nr:M23 family metallopeptidase [Rhodospirillales bacterium]
LFALDGQLARLETLQSAMPYLPLATPLITYYVTSKFGKRQDPVNKIWSMHYGTDMGATNKSAIFSTAPGVVSHAGWKGKYGNLVEIDHGNGLKTRFGHLSKFFVKKGQSVGFYEKIALVGSTGRSTGPHLHYEIVFNDKPVDPMNFVKAGRYVFQE